MATDVEFYIHTHTLPRLSLCVSVRLWKWLCGLGIVTVPLSHSVCLFVCVCDIDTGQCRVCALQMCLQCTHLPSGTPTHAAPEGRAVM